MNSTLLEFGLASHFFAWGTQDTCWLMNIDRGRGSIDSDSQSPKYQSRTLLANPTVIRNTTSKLPLVIILAFLLQYEKSSLEVEDC